MMLANRTSRYDVASAAVRKGAIFNPKVAVYAHEVESWLKHQAQKDREYILEHGQDPEDTFKTPIFE
ncbi:hypothetical protein PM082_005797 [Marasmius tenuissimus]|nr:hypothetical protein PM082_005797 [Marasmius tenuissimus]